MRRTRRASGRTHQGVSRAQFLRRGSIACLAGLPWAGVASGAVAANARSDRRILTFALQLEHLQLALYTQAAAARLPGDALDLFIRTAASHEKEHVLLIEEMLADDPLEPPVADFTAAVASRAGILTAVARLEDLGVAAYNGQAANLSAGARAKLARIASVDARHAAWARSLMGDVPAPRPVDLGRSPRAVTAQVARLGRVRGGG